MPQNRLAACALVACLAASLTACGETQDVDAERPSSLIGSWVGRGDGGALAAAEDSIALTLAADASADVRRWASPPAAHFDSTAHYALWKLTGASHDGGGSICLHLPATGANDCIPIRARAGDSMRLAFPSRPSAPGSVVDVTLHRLAAADSASPR